MHHIKGKSILQCLGERIDYSKNIGKTNQEEYISTYECDVKTAAAEFALAKREYGILSGREKKNNVIAYQVRQSFKPGEVTPEEANQIGYELAMRFLKGKHAFIVCTHVDKSHIHSHIIFNSTTLDCKRKYKDFLMNSLGEGYTEADIRAVLSGKCQHTPKKKRNPLAPQKDSLLVDIQRKMDEGKGAGYVNWAKKFNIKQMAQTVNYLREHGLMDYNVLKQKSSDATGRYNRFSDEIKAAEKRMAEIAVLKTHIINYSKTRDVYAAYRKSGYSKKYLAEHESEILLHKAAKKAFDESGMTKLPAVKSLQAEYAELLTKKKTAYSEYRTVREEMKELLLHKSNIDRMLEKEETTHDEEIKRACRKYPMKIAQVKKHTNLRVEQIHPFCVPTKRIFYPIKLHPHQIKPRPNARFPVYCKVYGYCTQMPAGKLCLCLPLPTCEKPSEAIIFLDYSERSLNLYRSVYPKFDSLRCIDPLRCLIFLSGKGL